MADLLALSDRIIDSGDLVEPWNRMTTEFSELNDDIGMIEAFSHVITIRTDDGLVLFDTSTDGFGPACVKSLRGWSTDPIHSLVYTHGHLDHVGGSGAFVADAEARGHAAPEVVGHDNVQPRFDRYWLTDGYNATVNERQFGTAKMTEAVDEADEYRFLPSDVAIPTQSYTTAMNMRVGDLDIALRHDLGETDDHTWAWIPQHKAICSGDFVTWVFPNAGNPQKVQRFPLEWAAALRSMLELEPELLLPAHGLPIGGRDRIATVLDDLATGLETLTRDVLALMNEGARLDTILHEVRVDPELLTKPYMRPIYDEPEFVVRNVWRLYGGWYNGNPAELKPAADADLAVEIRNLVGGVAPLLARAQVLSDDGEHRLASHLVEIAVQAEPTNTDAHQTRADVYRARRSTESSLMAKGIFRWASQESDAVVADSQSAATDAQE